MNTLRNFLYAIMALLTTALGALSAENRPAPPPLPQAPTVESGVKLTAPKPHVGKLYADTFLSLRTPDFTKGDYLYGVGIGYQASPYWSIEGRALHHGLDAAGSAVQSLGGRLVARMPFEFLAPYTFLGATFDLEDDTWRLQPGAGLEIGVSKKLRGLSLFAEGGLDADLRGRNGYLFTGGVRLRF